MLFEVKKKLSHERQLYAGVRGNIYIGSPPFWKGSLWRYAQRWRRRRTRRRRREFNRKILRGKPTR